MPIYEYQCDGCSEVFEVFQKVSDPPPAQHSCGSTQVHRILSNTSFVLKGTGWYITDYARKDTGGAQGGRSKKDGGDGSSGSSSGGSSSSSSSGGGGGSSSGGGGGSSSSSGGSGGSKSESKPHNGGSAVA